MTSRNDDDDPNNNKHGILTIHLASFSLSLFISHTRPRVHTDTNAQESHTKGILGLNNVFYLIFTRHQNFFSTIFY